MWFSIIFHCSYVVVAEEPRNRQSWLVIELSSRPATSGCEGRKANHPLTQRYVHVLNHIQRSWDEFPTKIRWKSPSWLQSVSDSFEKKPNKVNEGGNGSPRNKHLAWVSSRKGSCVTKPPDVWLVLVSWKSWRDTVIRSTWYFCFNQWKEPLIALQEISPYATTREKESIHRLKKCQTGKGYVGYVSFLEDTVYLTSYIFCSKESSH